MVLQCPFVFLGLKSLKQLENIPREELHPAVCPEEKKMVVCLGCCHLPRAYIEAEDFSYLAESNN